MNTNDQPATPSADEESATPRIYTKCPACRNDTLTINADKHLICTWISCPDPTLIDRISEVFPHKWEEAQRELASLQSARVEEIEEAKAVGAALFDQCESLRAALAERDREIEQLTKESRDVPLCAHHAEVWFCDRRFQPGDCWFCQQEKELQAATSRAEEAELNYEGRKATEEAANARVLALEAQVGELRASLRNLIFTATKCWDDVKPIKDGPALMVTHPMIEEAKAVLASQPDLPLIEEVREALSKCVVQLHHSLGGYILVSKVDEAHDAALRLLARLNPAK